LGRITWGWPTIDDTLMGTAACASSSEDLVIPHPDAAAESGDFTMDMSPEGKASATASKNRVFGRALAACFLLAVVSGGLCVWCLLRACTGGASEAEAKSPAADAPDTESQVSNEGPAPQQQPPPEAVKPAAPPKKKSAPRGNAHTGPSYDPPLRKEEMARRAAATRQRAVTRGAALAARAPATPQMAAAILQRTSSAPGWRHSSLPAQDEGPSAGNGAENSNHPEEDSAEQDLPEELAPPEADCVRAASEDLARKAEV